MDPNTPVQTTSPSGMEQPNTPSPLPKHSLKAPALIVAFFVLLLLAVTVGAFYMGSAKLKKAPLAQKTITEPTSKAPQTPTPTINPTANWKTYNDIQNGFSFQYPNRLSEDPDVPFGTLMPLMENGEITYLKIFMDTSTYKKVKEYTINGVDTGYRWDGIITIVYPNKNKKTLSQFANDYKDLLISGYKSYLKQDTTPSIYPNTMNGKEFFRTTGFDNFPINFSLFQLPNGEILAVNTMEVSKGSFNKDFNTIITTLTFLNSSLSISPTNEQQPLMCSQPTCKSNERLVKHLPVPQGKCPTYECISIQQPAE